MKSILTVLTGSPPAAQDLTILQTVKDELGITDAASDDLLNAYIARASGIISSITGRVYGQEALRESFYLSVGERGGDTLKLSRWPVAAVASITENGSVIVEDTDFIVDAEKGLLYRINGYTWTFSANPSIVVEYTAGYVLLGALPTPIEQATLMLVKSYYHSAGIDPAIRSETVEDIDSVTYNQGAADAEKAVRDILLGPYTELVVA